jgi:hypothetical protein
MDKQESQLLRNKGLMFFGRITAGQSHEVTNVLNVMNELAGLQGDILQASDRNGRVDLEKLKEINEKFQLQVQRGENIIRSINRFAHSVDSPIAVFDLKEALDQTIYLAQRLAHLGNAALKAEFPKESIPIETSLFGFKQAVLSCIEIAVAASSEQRRVIVSYRVVDGGGEVSVTSADPIPSKPGLMEECCYLELLMQELGGKAETVPSSAEPHRFTLFFCAQRAT